MARGSSARRLPSSSSSPKTAIAAVVPKASAASRSPSPSFRPSSSSSWSSFTSWSSLRSARRRRGEPTSRHRPRRVSFATPLIAGVKIITGDSFPDCTVAPSQPPASLVAGSRRVLKSNKQPMKLQKASKNAQKSKKKMGKNSKGQTVYADAKGRLRHAEGPLTGKFAAK